MAVSGFSKTILFISLVVSIGTLTSFINRYPCYAVFSVPSVHAAGCDRLALVHNGSPTNDTEFTVLTKRDVNLRIKCRCADKTQPVRWFFSSGTEVSSDKSEQIHTREKAKRIDDGNTLWILSDTSPLEYVGVYHCMSNKTNINIIVTGDLIACY